MTEEQGTATVQIRNRIRINIGMTSTGKRTYEGTTHYWMR